MNIKFMHEQKMNFMENFWEFAWKLKNDILPALHVPTWEINKIHAWTKMNFSKMFEIIKM